MPIDVIEDIQLNDEVIADDDAMNISPVSTSKNRSSALSSKEGEVFEENFSKNNPPSASKKEDQIEGIQTSLDNQIGSGENDVCGKKEPMACSMETMAIPPPPVVVVDDDEIEKVTTSNDDEQVNVSTSSAVSVSDDEDEGDNHEDIMTTEYVVNNEEEGKHNEKEKKFEIEMNDCMSINTATTVEASSRAPTLIDDNEINQERQLQHPQPESDDNEYGYEDCAPTVAARSDRQQQQPQPESNNDYGYEDSAPTVSARNERQRSVRRNRSGGGGGGRRGSLVESFRGWMEGNSDSPEGNSPPHQQHPEENIGNGYGYEDCAPTVAARDEQQRSIRRNRSGGGGGRRGSLVGAVMGWVEGNNNDSQEGCSPPQQQLDENAGLDFGYEDCAPTVATRNQRSIGRNRSGGGGRRGSLVGAVMGWVDGDSHEGHPPPQKQPLESDGLDYGYEDCAPTVADHSEEQRSYQIGRNRSGTRRGSLVGAVMGWADGTAETQEEHHQQGADQPQQRRSEEETNDYGYEDCAPTIADHNEQRSYQRGRNRSGTRRGSLVGAVRGWVEGSNESHQDALNQQEFYKPQQQQAEMSNDYGYEDCAPTVAASNEQYRRSDRRGNKSGSVGGRRGSLVGTVMGWVNGDDDVSAYGYEHAEPTIGKNYDEFENADLYGYGDAAPTVAENNQRQAAGRSHDGRPSNPKGRRGSLLDRVMGWEQQEDNPYGYEDAAPTTRRGSLLGNVMGWSQQEDNPYGYEDAAPTTRRGSLLGNVMGWNQQQEQAPSQAQPECPQQDPSDPNATGHPGSRRGSLQSLGSFLGWDQHHENPYGYEDDLGPSSRRGSMVDHIMAWAGAVNQEHFFHDSSSGLFNMGSSGRGESTSYEHRRASMDCVGSTDGSRPRMVPPIQRGSFRRAYSNDDAGNFDHDDQQGGYYDYDNDYSSHYNDDDSSYHMSSNGDDQSVYSHHHYAASAGFAHPGEQHGASCSSLKLHSPVPRVSPPPQSPRVGGHPERRNSLHAMVERAMAYVNMSQENDPRDGELCAFGTRRDSLFL